ncbi:NADPH-dependent FMN reductase [Streptomyces sp. Ru71]|uniref:NADPH-dependent FMN reductase n=1 Tax=Streptomyces sp. Ru71 TaxID=2080746 RepID=UPI000CDDCAC8|nr:NAD(P)H-dependent oxidoreductase [Streptomyces sp. Ru71]POX55048.1 NADPH-dependent FMN reductase [Streptomyces sp. Ru71]
MSREQPPLSLAVITATVRDGRFGPTVAQWFRTQAASRPDVVTHAVDLRDFPLPLTLPEPGQQPPAQAARVRDELGAVLARADAYVVVTPEYNHSFPASLKNVLDWFLTPWAAKPVGFVSYGGLAGGLRAVEQLRQVFAELHAVTVRESVSFHNAWERFDEHGEPVDTAASEAAAKTLLDQLVWWGRALRSAREEHPYGG